MAYCLSTVPPFCRFDHILLTWNKAFMPWPEHRTAIQHQGTFHHPLFRAPWLCRGLGKPSIRKWQRKKSNWSCVFDPHPPTYDSVKHCSLHLEKYTNRGRVGATLVGGRVGGFLKGDLWRFAVATFIHIKMWRTILDVNIGGWVVQKHNVNLTFCVVTWVWMAPLWHKVEFYIKSSRHCKIWRL